MNIPTMKSNRYYNLMFYFIKCEPLFNSMKILTIIILVHLFFYLYSGFYITITITLPLFNPNKSKHYIFFIIHQIDELVIMFLKCQKQPCDFCY